MVTLRAERRDWSSSPAITERPGIDLLEGFGTTKEKQSTEAEEEGYVTRVPVLWRHSITHERDFVQEP